jgi:hypothetical protein
MRATILRVNQTLGIWESRDQSNTNRSFLGIFDVMLPTIGNIINREFHGLDCNGPVADKLMLCNASTFDPLARFDFPVPAVR